MNLGISGWDKHRILHLRQYFLNRSYVLLACLLLLTATGNAFSLMLESKRIFPSPYLQWEPFIWEYSSALSCILLVPLIYRFTLIFPFRLSLNCLLSYLLAGCIYCLFHVTLMIIFREAVYSFSNSDYQFAESLQQYFFEMSYELQKDLLSFAILVALMELYRYLTERKNPTLDAIMPASNNDGILSVREEQQRDKLHFTIIKRGIENTVFASEIEWAETAGNYVNLYSNGEVYPLRITMTDFIAQTLDEGLIRVHRSYAVNRHFVSGLKKKHSGDGLVRLRSGVQVRYSRRYFSSFKKDNQR